MKITSKQLRRIIKEELNNVLETTVRPKDPLDYISDPNIKKKIEDLITQGEPEQAYELATMLQDKEGGYEGDDYMADVEFSKSKMDSDRLENLKSQAFEKISGMEDAGWYFQGLFFKKIANPAGVTLYIDWPHHKDQDIIDNPFVDSIYYYVNENEKLPDTDRSYTPHIRLSGIEAKSNEPKMTIGLIDDLVTRLSRRSGVEEVVIENEIIKFVQEALPNHNVKWK